MPNRRALSRTLAFCPNKTNKIRGCLINVYCAQYSLGNALAKELREAIYNGDSLIVDGGTQSRNQILDDTTGVRFQNVPGTALALTLSGELYPSHATLPTDGKAQGLNTSGSAQVQATFTVKAGDHEEEGQHDSGSNTNSNKGNGNNNGNSNNAATKKIPAIISNRHGAGRTLVFGFDLANTLLTKAGAWQSTVNTSFSALTPANPSILIPDAVLPVQTRITNLAQATDLSVKQVLPPGAVMLSTNPVGSYTAGTRTLDWTFTLAQTQTKDLSTLLQVPSAAGDYTLQTTVSSVKGGIATPYGAPLTLPIKVIAAAQTSADALAALKAYALTKQDDKKLRDQLVSALQSAMSNFGKNTVKGYDAAISALLDIAGKLNGLTAVDTSAVHSGVDRLLKEAQWRWLLAQPPGH